MKIRSVKSLLLGGILASQSALSLSDSLSYSVDNFSDIERRNDIVADIQELYIGILGRAADHEGLYYWADQIIAGTSTLENTRTAFTQQVEYTSIYAGLGNRELVTKIYQNFIEREPDAEGLAYWVGELDAGLIGPDSMVNAIINAVKEEGATNPQTLSDRIVLSNKVGIATSFTSFTQHNIDHKDFLGFAQRVIADVDQSYDSILLAQRQMVGLVGSLKRGAEAGDDGGVAVAADCSRPANSLQDRGLDFNFVASSDGCASVYFADGSQTFNDHKAEALLVIFSALQVIEDKLGLEGYEILVFEDSELIDASRGLAVSSAGDKRLYLALDYNIATDDAILSDLAATVFRARRAAEVGSDHTLLEVMTTEAMVQHFVRTVSRAAELPAEIFSLRGDDISSILPLLLADLDNTDHQRWF